MKHLSLVVFAVFFTAIVLMVSPAAAETLQSDYGPITVIRDGNGVFEATYSAYPGGYIYLTHQGGTRWSGYWRQDSSSTRCRTEKGTFYHGNLVVDSDPSGRYVFTGYWTYCDSDTSQGAWRAWKN